MHSVFQRCGVTPAQVLGIGPDRLNARAHAEFLLASEVLAQEARARLPRGFRGRSGIWLR